MIKEGRLKFIGLVSDVGELSKIKIFPEFCAGLQCLKDFSHVIIHYWFHLRDNEKGRSVLKVIPRRHPSAPQVGVFASRSPSRPNPIGLCVTELVEMEESTSTLKGLDALQNSPIIAINTQNKSRIVQGCILTVKGLDAVKGSPIIDIKPYLPRADSVPNARVPEWASQGPRT